MLEKDFNSLITKSLNTKGFGFKIPDTFSSSNAYIRSKAPYDIYGIYDNHFIAWESKWLNKPKAFNFNKLEEHQIDNLIKSYELLDNTIAVFAVGIDFGRNDKRVFLWKNEDLYKIKERKNNKKSILKKEFEQRTNFVKISKGLLDIDEVIKMPSDIYII